MKSKNQALILLLLLGYNIAAQTTIKGFVTDSLNNPIPGASVYLSKTTIGNLTNSNGGYLLIIPKDGVYEMITSCIGYKSNSQIVYSKVKNQFINIKLKVNLILLNEVIVRSKDKDRRKNYSQFLKSFIGETENSRICRIMNPDDLHLYFDSESGILKGYSLKPLNIENRALGYSIVYDLVDFNYNINTRAVKFSGYCNYRPLKGGSRRIEFWRFKRLAAYYGSKIHFMRALFSDSLARESYKLFECRFDNYKKMYSATLPVDEDCIRISVRRDYISFFHRNPLLISYTDNHPELSSAESVPGSSIEYAPGMLRINKSDWTKTNTKPTEIKPKEYKSVILFSDTLKLYPNGSYLKPYSITWTGEMANERIADALPYDFLPYEIVGVKPDTLSEVVVLPTQTTLETGPVQYAEKVYLHTDRTYYNSGDDIWFKSYVTDASNDKPSPIARNLHVELISSTSELIQSRVLRIEAGTGNGDFHLSDSLPSGRYTLRAYTNYMRNFDDHFFFNKGIVVVNPADRGNELIDSIKQVENKLDVSFYPEGGSLVDNVQSVVAFKAVDATGKGCDITGELYSSSGELITRFESTHLGMGLFTLKPIPGISYYAIMKNNAGAESKTTLPKSFPKGSTISTFVTVDNKLLLTVSLNEETLLSLKSSDLILTFSSRNLVIYTAKIQIGGLQNNYIIPVDKLSGGILKVTVTKSDGLPLSERLIYLEKHNKVFLNVVTDKNEYTPREKVIIGLSLSGSESVQEGTTLSISVVEKSFTDASLYPTTIASWFLLESDVRGPVEEPSYYFDPQNKNRLQDLDLLLLTQGWRDFQWKYDSLSAFSSEKGFTISGKVKRIIGDKPYEDAKLNVGIFGDNTSQVTTGKTDSMGVFRIEGIEFSGRKNLFISATGKNEVPVGRIFLDPLYYRPAEIEDIVPSFTTKILKPEIYNDLRQDVITKIALKKKYKLNDTIDIGEVIVTARKPDPPETIKVKESRRVYGTPDKEVIITPAMDNFAGDVFSLISGRFVGVQVKRKGMESVSVIIRGQKGTDGSSALILLDGFEVLPQDIVTSVLPLPVNMIDRIDVLNASPLYGMRGANGVVNIITRSTGPRRLPIELGPNSKNVVINGYDRPRIFYSPKHNIPSGSAEVPDIRTTIFWEPNIKIGKSGNAKLEYFNADNSTSITVIVEGITREGIPVTGKVRYEVR